MLYEKCVCVCEKDVCFVCVVYDFGGSRRSKLRARAFVLFVLDAVNFRHYVVE